MAFLRIYRIYPIRACRRSRDVDKCTAEYLLLEVDSGNAL